MSDAAALVNAALLPVLRADPGLRTAFADKKPWVYDKAPPASARNRFPYITLGLGHALDAPYEGLDAGDLEWTGHVWSRPDPPSNAEVGRLAAALKAAVIANAEALDLPGFRIVQAVGLDTQYLEDPDGMTLHAVVRVEISYDPV